MLARRPLTLFHVDAERGFSGGEAQVFLLMEGLRRRGHRNVLACPPGSRADQAARARGFELVHAPMRSDLDWPSVRALRRELQAIGPDLVHLHTGRATWLGGLAARTSGVPAITTRRMDRPVRRGWRTRLVYGPLPRVLGAPFVRRAVAISPAVGQCLARGGVDRARTRLIPSSVDPAALAARTPRAAVRAALGTREDVPVVLSLAALVRRKGLDLLLEALQELGARGLGFEAWIAGDGPERAALEARCGALALGSRVRFLGRREDAADLLHACDVFVLPARAEGLGVAALEAMAAGRAVVASRVGGLGEAVVDGRTGLLVEPEDPRALARALGLLIEDPGLRARLAAAGPARVAEGYEAEQMVEAYERLYLEVLAESAGGM